MGQKVQYESGMDLTSAGRMGMGAHHLHASGGEGGGGWELVRGEGMADVFKNPIKARRYNSWCFLANPLYNFHNLTISKKLNDLFFDNSDLNQPQ